MTDRTFPTAPAARKDHRETTLHGVTLTDDYAWLREKDDPEVTAYLKAENDYAEALTADLAPLRHALAQMRNLSGGKWSVASNAWISVTTQPQMVESWSVF